MDNFLLDNFPQLNSSMLATINSLYPEGAQFPSRGSFFSAAATVYGEMRYICPGIFISSAINQFRTPQPNWNYQ